MATPPILDVEALLRPISADRPSGESIAYGPEYDQIREARRAEDDTLQGDWQRKVKVADWDRVVELGTDCLLGKTKDLQVGAWMTEALARRHGFAGLRDGFRLMAGLLERFWETLYPELEDDDPESRAGPFVFLNDPKILPGLIRSIPLTSGQNEARYSFHRWQESRATQNVGLKDPDRMAELIAEGKITAQQFDDAAAQTPLRFLQALADDLQECADAFRDFDAASDDRFGRDAPSLSAIRKALDDCRGLVGPLLEKKQAASGAAAKPAEEAEPEEAPAEADDAWEESEAEEVAESESEDVSESEDDGEGVEEEEPEPEPVPRRASPSRRRSGGPIESVEDARARILDAAAYLREAEPGHPAAYLVVRSLGLGDLYALDWPPDPSALVGPPREARQALRRLAAEESWSELLDQAERSLGGPEGRAWLDAHRLALAALTASDLQAPAAAVRGFLRSVLADFPDLPRAELDDGTPAANAETLAWLQSEIQAAPSTQVDGRAEPEGEAEAFEPPPYEPPPAPAPGVEAEPDAWDLALEEVQGGRPAEAIQRLRRAVNAASSGREKFRRKLQLAELCLLARQPRIALPLLEDLARQVDEFRLEQWEDEALCARVWGTLYRCLRDSGAADDGGGERMRQAYTRLCRLDVHQALLYGGDEPT